MNADQRRFFDSLTESVLGAVFEVSNTLAQVFSRKSMNALYTGRSAFVGSGLRPKPHFQSLTKTTVSENTSPISSLKTSS
jgi:hypothetical protein